MQPVRLAVMPVIDDPLFYALAVPAVLLMGCAKSGFLMGFGSLATPLMALVIPVPQAAAIMLPLLLVMDFTGVRALWHERDRAMLKFMLPAGLLGTVIGTLLFGALPVHAVSGVVGAITLAFLAQRLLFPPRRDATPPVRVAGFVLTAIGGFTSFVAHAGGPPVQAYVLPLRIEPLRLSATLAVLFTAINLSKWIPYAWLGLLDARNLGTSLLLVPLAPLGVWGGVWATRRVDQAWFYRLAYVGMGLTGLKLLYDGLSG
jgi:uncharacterized membrane protein YfcA